MNRSKQAPPLSQILTKNWYSTKTTVSESTEKIADSSSEQKISVLATTNKESVATQEETLSLMHKFSHSDVTTLAHIQWFCYNANSELVVPSMICFSNLFPDKTAHHLNALDTITPISAPFVNLAIADPTTICSQGNYIVLKADSHTTCFFCSGSQCSHLCYLVLLHGPYQLPFQTIPFHVQLLF